MKIIETVAKGLWLVDHPGSNWDYTDKTIRGIYKQRAFAAIEAMREPNKSMSEAAANYKGQMSYNDVYTTMIDAALKE